MKNRLEEMKRKRSKLFTVGEEYYFTMGRAPFATDGQWVVQVYKDETKLHLVQTLVKHIPPIIPLEHDPYSYGYE